MAETFKRLPEANGDNNVWADYLLSNLTQLYGIYTAKLYASAGSLYVSIGKIGIFDDTNKGVVDITSAKLIDISGCSASNWCKIEMSVSGTVATFAASDIAGATDPAALPSDFKDAFVGTKGGFYITATKRIIGLAWRNAGGTLEGVVNCLPFIDGWIGYCQSNDANDIPYIFEKHKETSKAQEGHRIFNEQLELNNCYSSDTAGVLAMQIAHTQTGTGSGSAEQIFIVKKPITVYFKSVCTKTGFNTSSGGLNRYQNSAWNAVYGNLDGSSWSGSTPFSNAQGTKYLYGLQLQPGQYKIIVSNLIADGSSATITTYLYITEVIGHPSLILAEIENIIEEL